MIASGEGEGAEGGVKHPFLCTRADAQTATWAAVGQLPEIHSWHSGWACSGRIEYVV